MSHHLAHSMYVYMYGSGGSVQRAWPSTWCADNFRVNDKLFRQNLSSVKFKKISPQRTQFEMLTLIKSLKPKKSAGHDNISALFIKNNKDTLSKLVSILLNKSIEVVPFLMHAK